MFWLTGDTVTSFKIPVQEVTGTECEFKEELGGDGIVHSHPPCARAKSELLSYLGVAPQAIIPQRKALYLKY